MKLHELKTKYIAKLTLYEPKNEREEYLIDVLVRKLYNLRMLTLPDLVVTLREIYKNEPQVSEDLKRIIKEMIEAVLELQGTQENKE